MAIVVGAAILCAAQVCAQDAAPIKTTVRSAPPKPAGGMFESRKCSGPIDVTSDNFVGNLDTKVGNYLGNVIVIRDQCKLRADKVVAEAVGGNTINRLTAVGNVVFLSSSGTATGDNGVYDLTRKTVTLAGTKVVLVKGKDVMRGTLLVVDTNTGLAHLTARGMPGNRVHTSFTPKTGAQDAAHVKPVDDTGGSDSSTNANSGNPDNSGK
jgi:lipopolysaccharide export system protein LptA